MKHLMGSLTTEISALLIWLSSCFAPGTWSPKYLQFIYASLSSGLFQE